MLCCVPDLDFKRREICTLILAKDKILHEEDRNNRLNSVAFFIEYYLYEGILLWFIIGFLFFCQESPSNTQYFDKLYTESQLCITVMNTTQNKHYFR